MKKKIQKDSLKIQELKKKARRYSIKEGIFASAKTSFGDHFISPFAIAINSSNSLIAMLSSISGLLGPLSQTFGSRLIEKYSRKKIVLHTILFEALMWLPIILIGFLFYRGIIVNVLPIMLLLFFSIYVAIGNLGHPAWFSWMGDIVEEKQRGRWFSKRNLITGFVSVIVAISAAFFLDYFKKSGWIIFGFIILFFLAFLSRIICWKIFFKKYEPQIKLKKGYYFSFWDFIIKAPTNNFGQFTIFRALLGFSTSITAPLLAIYLLRYLEFDYKTYMIILFAGTIFSLVVLKLWGKFADRYGNYRTLCITGILIPIVPILWILNTSPIYLFLVPSIIGGISWAGFNLAAGNFIYDNVSSQKRSLAISYYNMLIGIGVFFGAGLSAILIKFLTISFIEPLFFIFILGSIARGIIMLIWLPKLKEVRQTKTFSSSKALRNLIFKEGKTTLLEEAHEIASIKKYLDMK